MKNLSIFALILAVGACSTDTKVITDKLEAIQREQVAQRELLKGMVGGRGAANPAAIGAAGAAGNPAAAARPQRVEPDKSKTYAVPITDDPFDGPADAKVTVVKAYDYACPYCERVRPTMEELKAKYGQDIRIVYKQLVVHPRQAMAGALAFCAASKQGKGREMDAMIWDSGFKNRQFDNSEVEPAEAGAAGAGQTQKCWDTADGCKLVVGYAQQLGLDSSRFKNDMKSCVQHVQSDANDLRNLSVSATPSFFINGRFIAGAVPTEQFTSVIDEELNLAKQRIAQGTPAGSYYQAWVLDKGLKTVEKPAGQ